MVTPVSYSLTRALRFTGCKCGAATKDTASVLGRRSVGPICLRGQVSITTSTW
jgi:hypothetical protein